MTSEIVNFCNTYSNDFEITIKPKCLTSYKLEVSKINSQIDSLNTLKRLKRYIVYYFIVEKYPYLKDKELSLLLDCSVWNIMRIRNNIEMYIEKNFDGIKDTIDKLKQLV